MLDFQVPKLSDKGWVDALLKASPQRACDYNFANLFMWGPNVSARIARLDNWLIIQAMYREQPVYLWPVGTGDVRQALLILEADAAEWGRPLYLAAVTEEHRQQLEALYPGQFEFREEPANADYLYDINRLADLPGKKLHAKRNHINRFIENNPTWTYEEITEKSLPECMEMDRQWYLRNREKADARETRDMNMEAAALNRAVENYAALGMEGGLLRVYGEVVAFTMGTPMGGDTFDVHYEKAYSELQGAYAMINREFARQVRRKHPEVVYLNRENDMGVEGLRKAKQSYYPDKMVVKYHAIKKTS